MNGTERPKAKTNGIKCNFTPLLRNHRWWNGPLLGRPKRPEKVSFRENKARMAISAFFAIPAKVIFRRNGFDSSRIRGSPASTGIANGNTTITPFCFWSFVSRHPCDVNAPRSIMKVASLWAKIVSFPLSMACCTLLCTGWWSSYILCKARSYNIQIVVVHPVVHTCWQMHFLRRITPPSTLLRSRIAFTHVGYIRGWLPTQIPFLSVYSLSTLRSSLLEKRPGQDKANSGIILSTLFRRSPRYLHALFRG